ncbi:coiled-coil domain-containing protein 201, partial [Pipistrellus kuhlii]|uniref:coiled-coil domain-containing protein 201 n=1 Tax=Pipistrellus kuhlii TaxID=59472 RepID=UPI001E2709E8
ACPWARRRSSGPAPRSPPCLSQVSEWSSSEDEAPPFLWSPSGSVLKHSTPAEGAPGWGRSPRGPRPSRLGGGPGDGSPRPGCASWGLPAPGPRKQRLSTIWASEESGPPAPEGEPPAPTEATCPPRPQPQRKAEPGGPPGGWVRSQGLPGISDDTTTAGRRRRDPRKLAAVTERVRQWEARQLQSIEEATQHNLTVQDE